MLSRNLLRVSTLALFFVVGSSVALSQLVSFDTPSVAHTVSLNVQTYNNSYNMSDSKTMSLSAPGTASATAAINGAPGGGLLSGGGTSDFSLAGTLSYDSSSMATAASIRYRLHGDGTSTAANGGSTGKAHGDSTLTQTFALQGDSSVSFMETDYYLFGVFSSTSFTPLLERQTASGWVPAMGFSTSTSASAPYYYDTTKGNANLSAGVYRLSAHATGDLDLAYRRYGGVYDFQTFLNIQAVPEPASVAFLSMTLLISEGPPFRGRKRST